MKISVLMPSRGRAWMLQQAILSLFARASGRIEIECVIGCDADDPRTDEMAYVMRLRGLPVRAGVAVRSPSLGGIVNTLSLAAPADVYCALCDDILVLTENWDEKVAEAWRARDDGVWWWKNVEGATYAIVSEKWRRAAGRIMTDYFPSWWDDVWLYQLWLYASGERAMLVDAELQDRRPGTHRMRDLAKWTRFYWSREGERLKEARRIRAKLGWPAVRLKQQHRLMPNDDFMRRIGAIEEQQGDRAPPTPEYTQALARAELLMAA